MGKVQKSAWKNICQDVSGDFMMVISSVKDKRKKEEKGGGFKSIFNFFIFNKIFYFKSETRMCKLTSISCW